jgi:hypothetical protein
LGTTTRGEDNVGSGGKDILCVVVVMIVKVNDISVESVRQQEWGWESEYKEGTSVVGSFIVIGGGGALLSTPPLLSISQPVKKSRENTYDWTPA